MVEHKRPCLYDYSRRSWTFRLGMACLRIHQSLNATGKSNIFQRETWNTGLAQSQTGKEKWNIIAQLKCGEHKVAGIAILWEH